MPGMHAEAHVAVPPERVWALLTCFEDYPLWTRALALSGKLEPHAPVDYVVPLARPAGPIRRLALPCEVTRLTPARSLALSFGWPGIIRYELSFELERDGDGSRLRHGIEAQSFLSRVIEGRLQRLLKRPFETFVNDVRHRLAAQAAPKPKPKPPRAGKSRVPRDLPPPKRGRRR